LGVTLGLAELEDVIRVGGARRLGKYRQHPGYSAMTMRQALGSMVQHQLQSLLARAYPELMVGIQRAQQSRQPRANWRKGSEVNQ
jgi:hypothetical protein